MMAHSFNQTNLPKAKVWRRLVRKVRHGHKPAVLEEQAPPIATGTQLDTQKALEGRSEKLASQGTSVHLIRGGKC